MRTPASRQRTAGASSIFTGAGVGGGAYVAVQFLPFPEALNPYAEGACPSISAAWAVIWPHIVSTVQGLVSYLRAKFYIWHCERTLSSLDKRLPHIRSLRARAQLEEARTQMEEVMVHNFGRLIPGPTGGQRAKVEQEEVEAKVDQEES